jgi:hypothetical protein
MLFLNMVCLIVAITLSIMCISLFVLMVILASYILWKTHRLDLDVCSKVMQKNVAAVSFLFCVCLIPTMIQHGEVAFPWDGKLITYLETTVSLEISSFFGALNCAANIFIYMAVSKKFRTTLFDIFTV